MEKENEGVIIVGMDIVDVVDTVEAKRRKFIALTMQDVEELKLNISEEEFKLLRKAILDGFGNYTRSFVRAFFGEIEGFPPVRER